MWLIFDSMCETIRLIWLRVISWIESLFAANDPLNHTKHHETLSSSP